MSPRRKKREPKISPVHPEVLALDNRIAEARQALDELEEERHKVALRLVVEKLAAEPDPEADPDDPSVDPKNIILGDCWECDKSPTGLCVYDDENDSCHDQCLFCGEPEERK